MKTKELFKIIDKIAEKVKNSDDLSTEINNLITQKYGYNPELEDKVMEHIILKLNNYGENERRIYANENARTRTIN